jgi:hypothetical protein
MPQGRDTSPILAAEIAREIGQSQELVRILEWVIKPHQHDVRSGADAGGNGSLWTDILPTFVVDPDFDAGLFRELPGICNPLLLITFDKGCPSQHAQDRAGLRCVAWP